MCQQIGGPNMKNSKGPLRISWQRVSLSILCVLLALVLFVMLFATAYIHHLLSLVTSNNNNDLTATIDPTATIPPDDDHDPDFTGPTAHPSDVPVNTIPSQPVENLQTEGIINIMLIGEDRRPGQGRQRSDSMILCSFNTKTHTLTMISFLRDTYIPQIPGYKAEKLNAAYAKGGVNMLDQTLAAYFGVHVDANIAVQFDGFKAIIDLLGGVDIELTQQEVNHLRENAGIYGDSWNLKVGMNHLNGEQALAYSRIRKIDMDAMRAQRQRKVLTAIINAYKSKPVGEMLSLASQILQMGVVQTDMTSGEVLSYVSTLFPMLATATINSQQIPAENTYTSMTVGSISATKVCDFEVNRKILQNILQ